MTNALTGIVFPGQGSQSVGMLSDVINHFPETKLTFNEASQALGYDMLDLISHDKNQQLDATEFTQPALLASSVAIWRLLKDKSSVQPALLAGHSLGEYTALVCADAVSFADALRLVAARGRYMQEAVAAGSGAMAAIIGLDDASVATLCRDAIGDTNDVLSPANFNSVGQVVIAGDRAAVERALPLAKTMGAKMAVLIPVSVPSHCALMKPAAERLQALLQTITFNAPNIPVISNVDVIAYKDAAQIRDGLVRQLYMPVRWVETIQYFAKQHIQQVIECGPGKVLSGLNKRIDKSLTLVHTCDLSGLESILNVTSERGAKC